MIFFINPVNLLIPFPPFISIHQMIFFIHNLYSPFHSFIDFNSSNDILYQYKNNVLSELSTFQFIKWYSLSVSPCFHRSYILISIHQMIFFIPPFYHILHFSTTLQHSLFTTLFVFLPTILSIHSLATQTCFNLYLLLLPTFIDYF